MTAPGGLFFGPPHLGFALKLHIGVCCVDSFYAWQEKRAASPVSPGGPDAFRAAWAEMEAQGYQYGEDAIESVRLGWELAMRHIGSKP